MTDQDTNAELRLDLKEAILHFYQALFSSLERQVNACLLDQSNSYAICLSPFEDLINNESFISQIEQTCLCETEAFTRRYLIKFLTSLRLYTFRLWCLQRITSSKRPDSETVGSFNVTLWNSCNYFSYILSNEFDWQVQLHVVEYFKELVDCVTLLLAKYEPVFVTNKDSMAKCSSKLVSDFAKYDPFEVIFYFSECLKSLVKSVGDFDQYVVHSAASLALELKENTSLVGLLKNIDAKHNTLFQREVKSTYVDEMKACLSAKKLKLAVGIDEQASSEIKLSDVVSGDDEENHLRKFIISISSEYLKSKLEESKQTSDIYIRNPVGILDDIISSYQFDIDEEKAVDCY